MEPLQGSAFGDISPGYPPLWSATPGFGIEPPCGIAATQFHIAVKKGNINALSNWRGAPIAGARANEMWENNLADII